MNVVLRFLGTLKINFIIVQEIKWLELKGFNEKFLENKKKQNQKKPKPHLSLFSKVPFKPLLLSIFISVGRLI